MRKMDHKFAGSRSVVMEGLDDRRMMSVTPSLVAVPISAGAIAADPALAGYKSYELRVTATAGDSFNVAGINVKLTSGTLYNPSLGGNTANPALWTLLPHLEYDTFVTAPRFGVVNGLLAYKVGSEISTSTQLNAAWSGVLGSNSGSGTFVVARFTATSNAVGSVSGQVFGKQNPGASQRFGSTLVAIPTTATNRVLKGALFEDRNNNGTRQSNERYLGGKTVFLDMNKDGVLQDDEPRAVTDSQGRFTITGVNPGSYKLRTVGSTSSLIVTASKFTTPGGAAKVVLAFSQVPVN